MKIHVKKLFYFYILFFQVLFTILPHTHLSYLSYCSFKNSNWWRHKLGHT